MTEDVIILINVTNCQHCYCHMEFGQVLIQICNICLDKRVLPTSSKLVKGLKTRPTVFYIRADTAQGNKQLAEGYYANVAEPGTQT